MTYAVIWTAAAVAELARVAAELADPEAADRESVLMDSLLRRYPHAMGESRWASFRLWYGDVIGVWYTVDLSTMTVHILTVGPARRRRR